MNTECKSAHKYYNLKRSLNKINYLTKAKESLKRIKDEITNELHQLK